MTPAPQTDHMNVKNTLLILLASAVLASAADPAVELEAAIRRETVQGDLKGAAEAYKKIAANAAANRDVAARALLRLAMVYRKQGDAQARQTLDRVLRDFADQARTVAEARAEIARMAPAAGKDTTAIRQIWKGKRYDVSSVSADGTLAGCLDQETANLCVMDLRSGTPRLLTDYGHWNQLKGAVNENRISPDGKWIAFHARLHSGGELRLIRTDGTEPKVLHRGTRADRIFPKGWTPDSQHILAAPSSGDLILISVATGEQRTVLKGTPNRAFGTFLTSISPDGKWLAYSSSLHPLCIVSMAGSGDVRFTSEEKSDSVIGWSPDSKQLVFAASRSGVPAIWRRAIQDGRAAGPPELVRSLPEMPVSAGFDAKGTLYFTGFKQPANALTLDLGVAAAEPRRVTARYDDNSHGPLWSPDGKQLAWFGLGPNGAPKEMFVREIGTGSERAVPLPSGMLSIPSPAWLTNGQGILISSWAPIGERTTYRINPRTGETVKILTTPSNAAWEASSNADGSKFYRAQGAAILETDVSTGTEKEVYREPIGYVRDWAVSPDGASIAYVSHQPAPTDKPELYGPVHIKVVHLPTGQSRELVAVRPAWYRRMMTWTPDGQSLIYATEMYAGKSQPTRLWRVPAAGGTPVQIGKDFSGRVFGLVVSPDGKQLGFDESHEILEVYAIEGLFPR